MSNPSTSISALAHVCLRTKDLEAKKRFYGQALGLPIHFRFMKNGHPMGFYLKIAEKQFIEVFYNDAPEFLENDSALAHFCLETSDVLTLRKHLVGMGYETTEIKEGRDHSLQFWAIDPDGVRVEFQQYRPSSLQLTGGDVEVS